MLDLDPEVIEMVVDLCDGNPGALTVLMSTYREVGTERFLPFATSMKERGICGSEIWCNFKDVHGQDIEAFVRANTIADRQGLVEHTKEQESG